MKKLILFLIALSFSVIGMAQLATVTVANGGTFGSGAYTTTNTATRITNTTAGYILFKAANPFPSTQDFAIKLDSVSGNHTNVAAQVYGQKSELKGDWTTIGSAVNWKGTTKDTVIVISNASANRYRNYKIILTGTGAGVTRVLNAEVKLFQE